MLFVLQLLRRNSSHISHRLGAKWAKLRVRLKLNLLSFDVLLFLLSCYIVASRCGPFVSRAGDLAIETFDVERLIVEEYDLNALRLFREAFDKFRVVTRAPYPPLALGRFPQDISQTFPPDSTMGGKGSKPETATVKTSLVGEAVKQEVDNLDAKPSQTDNNSCAGKTPQTKVGPETVGEEGEGEGEGGEEGERVGEGEVEEGDVFMGSPLSVGDRLPMRVTDLRKESVFSYESQGGSTESIIGLFAHDRLNPAEYKNKPIKFKKVQPTLRTGDLALLYRRDQEVPHVAIFINHIETDPLFPLLLVKAKTKPLPLAKFSARKPRFIHPITATTRIFYGDYERVAVRYLDVQSDNGTTRIINPQEAMDAIARVEAIPFSPKECKVIAAAETDQERSVNTSTFMAAHYYKELGIFKGTPDNVTPEDFLSQLPLSDPIFIKLPHMKLGPMVHGDPPFLKQLVDGVVPAHSIVPVPYDKAIEGLDTGDIILFSGATSAGAVIKFFDHSQFSHVALVLKAQYTSQLLIWEASSNHAKLVDVQHGTVRTGVEVLPLRNKVFSGWYDRVAIRRLLHMTPEKRQEIYDTMLRLRKEWMGRSYEKNMVQLALAAINPSDSFLSLFQNTHEDLSSLFCSELVAAAYQRMGLIKNDRPSNTYTPDDFSSARDASILNEGVELGSETYIELKWPRNYNGLSTQESVY